MRTNPAAHFSLGEPFREARVRRAAKPRAQIGIAGEFDQRARGGLHVAQWNQDAFLPVTHEIAAPGRVGRHDWPAAGSRLLPRPKPRSGTARSCDRFISITHPHDLRSAGLEKAHAQDH